VIITIIAEPRTGSTSLAHWFFLNKNYTVLFEPITNPNTMWYKYNTQPNEWLFNTKNLLVKEVFNNVTSFENLISISDKIICLYREDETSQIESYYNASKTKKWHTQWIFKKNKLFISENEISYFKKLKSNFKETYIDNGKYFTISYENLYYKNKIQDLIEYIGDDGMSVYKFPYGDKYRVDATNTKNII